MQKSFDKIHSLLADGKATQALRHLIDAQTSRLRKDLAWDANHAWYCVGCAYFSLEDFKPAVQAYRKACRANPQDALSLWALGNSYDALGRPKLAERAFRLALGQNMKGRNRAAVLFNLGNALFDQKRFDEAGRVYVQVKGRRDEIGTKARKNLNKAMALMATTIKKITLEKNPNYHCILCVRSNEERPLLQAMLPRRIRRLEITDRDSPEEKAAAVRRRQLGFSLPSSPFRYFGVLSSSGQVKGPDMLKHVEWLFSNFRPEFDLAEWKLIGAEYELSFAWWGGLGTAYGPSIAPELADILARHRVPLEISIY